MPRTSTSGSRAAACSRAIDGGDDWQPLNAGSRRDVPARPRARVRPRPALRAAAPAPARPAVPAEPLRDLPHGTARGPVAAHRRQHAARRRRHRVPDRAAPARSRHRVGVPDGRHRRVAAHEPRRQTGRVRHPRRGRVVDALRRRPSRARVVHREAPGDDRRRRTIRSASTSARRAARSGRAPTKARRGSASPSTCPRSTRSSTPIRRTGRERPHPEPAALVHAATGGRRRRRRRPSPRCSPISTGAIRASGSAWSTSRAASAST